MRYFPASSWHTHYEVSWLGLGEEEARAKYKNVIVIKMPPNNPNGLEYRLASVGPHDALVLMEVPHKSGFQKLLIDGNSRDASSGRIMSVMAPRTGSNISMSWSSRA